MYNFEYKIAGLKFTVNESAVISFIKNEQEVLKVNFCGTKFKTHQDDNKLLFYNQDENVLCIVRFMVIV